MNISDNLNDHGSDLKVKMHPIIVMNISDHLTRVSSQNKKITNIVGALLGTQKGREMEICNSFGLVYDDIQLNGEHLINLDMEYFEKRKLQFKQVFADLDIVGWYSLGAVPSAALLRVHRALCADNAASECQPPPPQSTNTTAPPSGETGSPTTDADNTTTAAAKPTLMATSSAAIACASPLLLLLDPAGMATNDDPTTASSTGKGSASTREARDCAAHQRLPIALFESWRAVAGDPTNTTAMDVCGETSAGDTSTSTTSRSTPATTSTTSHASESSRDFKPVPYEMITDASERIAIDQVSAVTTQQAGVKNQAVFEMERNAVAMLKHRVSSIQLYLSLVINGDLTVDAAILRRLESVCRRLALPLGGASCLEASGSSDCNTAVMLAMAARASTLTDHYVDKKQREKHMRYIPKKRNRNQYF